MAFILTRPLGAGVGNFFDNSGDLGGLALSRLVNPGSAPSNFPSMDIPPCELRSRAPRRR